MYTHTHYTFTALYEVCSALPYIVITIFLLMISVDNGSRETTSWVSSISFPLCPRFSSLPILFHPFTTFIFPFFCPGCFCLPLVFFTKTPKLFFLKIALSKIYSFICGVIFYFSKPTDWLVFLDFYRNVQIFLCQSSASIRTTCS